MNIRTFKILALILILTGVQSVFAQFTNRVVQLEPADVTVLHNNGEFRTRATAERGTKAPEGFVWSENPHDTDDTEVANSVSGFGTTFPQVRLADNFTVPEGQIWIISSVTVWGFQQGWNGNNSPFSGGTLQIWDGVPGEAGSSVIFGDLNTDRLLSSTESNTYAIFNSAVPNGGFTPNTQRHLWENKLSVAPTLTLGPGTYWIDFATTTFNGVSATFHRNVISPGNRTQPGWDARQYVLSSDSWEDVLDGGTPSSAPDVPQDIAFNVNGIISSGNSDSTFADFDGDGKMDFGVTRWAASVVDPCEWFILKSSGSNGEYDYNVFGVRAAPSRFISGVGIADIVLPEDYDGDGKADPAVWRQGTNAAPQSTFYVQKSTDGELIVADFGLRNDRPVLGDFDGDGKQDFSVFRINSAVNEATLYTLQSSDLSVKVTELPYPFINVLPGDYDGDGKTDIATFKRSVNDMVWTITTSSDGVTKDIRAGNAFNDIPVQGDYNGDGKTQIAVYRKTGTGSANPSAFWVIQEDGSYNVIPWGHGFDFPIAGRAY